jgi:DNA polymerase-3 subunit beta
MRTSLTIESRGEEIRVAVPAKMMTEVLKQLPEQPITISINEENFGIDIIADSGKYHISSESGADFPKLPSMDRTSSIQMECSILLKAVNKTLFAASTDELKPAMNGIFFNFSNNNVTFVATDAHRLVRYRRVDITAPEAFGFIVPQRSLNLFKSAFGSLQNEILLIDYNETNIFFKAGEMMMSARLIEDRFPDYENVIPTENPNRMIIARKELLGSLKRVNIFANRTTHQVRLKIAGSELHVSAEDIDFNNQANENLKCIYEGEDIEIGFNCAFLIEVIQNIDTDEVVLELSSPNRAVIVMPENQEDGENVLMLMMPVILNTYA